MHKVRVAAIAARGEQIKQFVAASDCRTHDETTIMKMKHDLRPTDRCFDIDELTNDTLPRPHSGAQQGPLGYGKLIDAHRLAAVSENGGWWNSTTQELIPILPEDDPNYRQNEEIITAALRRWSRGTSK